MPISQDDLTRELGLAKLRYELKDALEALNDNRVTAASEEAEKLTHRTEQLVEKDEEQQFEQNGQTDTQSSITKEVVAGTVLGMALAGAAGIVGVHAFFALCEKNYKWAAALLTMSGMILFCGQVMITTCSHRDRESQNASGFFAQRPVVTEKKHSEPVGLAYHHS